MPPSASTVTLDGVAGSRRTMQPFETAPRFTVMDRNVTTPDGEAHTELSTTEARQAQTGLGARYVLAISLSAALAALAIVYFIYFSP